MKRELGGKRLGSGNKMTVDLKTYNRSTHDLGYIWRSTMAAGTLIPFINEVALPGDTFDIDLDADIKTHPTIGPLFGSYKLQLDVFSIPMRLYNSWLHNNKLKVGMDMSQVKLPQILMQANNLDLTKQLDNQQINPSSIFSYLNIRGLGYADSELAVRLFNGLPYLMYWDIYKNYYANKQEEIGAVIHYTTEAKTITNVWLYEDGGAVGMLDEDTIGSPLLMTNDTAEIQINYLDPIPNTEIMLYTGGYGSITAGWNKIEDIFENYVIDEVAKIIYWQIPKAYIAVRGWKYADPIDGKPRVTTFPLENIDNMRETILATAGNTPLTIGQSWEAPYGLALQGEEGEVWAKEVSQEGLALKTYQSDLFNNWLNEEWIEGTNGINAITAIDTSSGSFTIDTLNLSKKVYDMLNRIAVSGGTYEDWLDVQYTSSQRRWRPETPVYVGSLIKEVVFQEVVSQASAEGQPLATLAGKGIMGKKHKGGKVTVKVDEPSYIMGIVSLTPRVDYSQGNKWDTNLKTMDDLHKPALDEIGFQDLITDQMAFWDTRLTGSTPTFKSAGKQPAWINYMTNVNQTRGNFAIEDNEMFMTLNRRYESDEEGFIKDLTTYIDPVKYNFIFAETARDAQNFWAQIAVDMTVRREISARVIPNP